MLKFVKNAKRIIIPFIFAISITSMYENKNNQDFPLVRIKTLPGKIFELLHADFLSKGDDFNFNCLVQSKEYGICSEHTDNIEFLSSKESKTWREKQILVNSGIDMNIHDIGSWNCVQSPINKCVYQ